MSQTEYLNVDEIAPKIAKIIKIKGKEHKLQPPKLGDFLDEIKRIRALQKKAEKSGQDDVEAFSMMVESMRSSVATSFPTLSETELNDLSYEQIRAIQEFIKAQFSEENEAAEDEAGNG